MTPAKTPEQETIHEQSRRRDAAIRYVADADYISNESRRIAGTAFEYGWSARDAEVEQLKAKLSESEAGAGRLRGALDKIASCTPVITGDCPSIAREALSSNAAGASLLAELKELREAVLLASECRYLSQCQECSRRFASARKHGSSK